MSTKVYYGIRFSTSRLSEPGFITSLKEAMYGAMLDALSTINDAGFGEIQRHTEGIPVLSYHNRKLKEASTIKEKRFYTLNMWLMMPNILETFESTLVLFIGPEWTLGWLMSFHGISRIIMRELNNISGVEEFSYWNNVDQPDHIDDAHWLERAQLWDRVVENDRIFIYGVDEQSAHFVADYIQKALQIGSHDPDKRKISE